ncbi:unnamed protein product, partial [Prorocentrum cordatum]
MELESALADVQSSMAASYVEVGKAEELLVKLQAADLGDPLKAASASLDVAVVEPQAGRDAVAVLHGSRQQLTRPRGVNVPVDSDDIDVGALQGDGLARRQADFVRALGDLRK